ncbi:MAG: hypothetical protein H7Y17_11785 [Chlorobia bacterium]|nr:hypothetical protein [Fimbriimonadaceae bacterium]
MQTKHWWGLGILGLMVFPIVVLLLAQDSFTANLDRLAKSRDVPGLTAASAPNAWKGRNPFAVFKTNGAYETGKFGWTAITGTAPWRQKYVVFSTPLTSEDVGERLFEWDGSRLTKFIDEREDFGWRIGMQGMTVTFDIPAKKVSISCAFPVHTTGKSPNLMFRLGPNYRVKSVARNLNEPMKWTQIGGIVMVAGAKDGEKLSVNYEGIVDRPGYAGSIRPNEALLTNDYWYPMIARKPTPFALMVRGPKTWTAVANGDLLESSIVGDYRVTFFSMEMPISYWSLNIGPYKVVTEELLGRNYTSWSMALSDEQMKLQPLFFPKIIETMETFGKFPFSGYGSVMTPTYGGGALEAYSFVTSGYFSGEDAHEVAHTWFGGMVNNTYLTSLWNESFAVWGDGFYFRNARFGDPQQRSFAYIQTPQIDREAFDLAPLNDAPAEIGPAATTLGYGKGAFVLQMLEQELGTPTMIKVCREWLASHDKTVGGEWEGFEKAVNAGSGRDMKWFFDQWVRRPGYADFEITGVKFANGSVSGNVAFKGKPYRITCEVLLVEGGKRQFTNFDLKSGAFSFPVAGKPSLVSFDPWRRIMRPIGEDETPVELNSVVRSLRRVDYRPERGWLQGVGGPKSPRGSGGLDGLFLVGTPADDSALRDLYTKAGIMLEGNLLTYQGAKIDLSLGGFVALVDLPGGGRCAIGAGKVRYPPRFGRTRLMVFDELGRFVRGVTEPKTRGNLTFRL